MPLEDWSIFARLASGALALSIASFPKVFLVLEVAAGKSFSTLSKLFSTIRWLSALSMTVVGISVSFVKSPIVERMRLLLSIKITLGFWEANVQRLIVPRLEQAHEQS